MVNFKFPSLKLTASPWKSMVGRRNFEARPIFRGGSSISDGSMGRPYLASKIIPIVACSPWRCPQFLRPRVESLQSARGDEGRKTMQNEWVHLRKSHGSWKGHTKINKKYISHTQNILKLTFCNRKKWWEGELMRLPIGAVGANCYSFRLGILYTVHGW